MKATVIATLALFVALTGAGTAAYSALAPRNTVNSASIIDGAVRIKDIAPSTARLLKGQRGETGLTGSMGPPGPAGPAGANGLDGGFDPAKVQHVSGPEVVVPGYYGIASTTADCPPGTVLIGGGAYTSGEALWVSRPSGNSWFAGARGYGSGVTAALRATAICASP
jgi:hypothetical protein